MGLAKVNQSGQQHGKGLGLSIRPLRTIRQSGHIAIKGDAGCQSVEGQFARCKCVDMLGGWAKGRAAILPDDPSIPRNDTAAPIKVNALQNTGGIAHRVNCPKKNGVPVFPDMGPWHSLGQ